MEFFEDVKIVSFDDSRVERSRLDPSFKRLALVLSSVPPPGWGPMLQDKYKSMWSADKRIEVVGQTIWIDCPPENLQAVIDELKPMVVKTNAEIRAKGARLAIDEETRDHAATADKERLATTKKNLKFD